MQGSISNLSFVIIFFALTYAQVRLCCSTWIY